MSGLGDAHGASRIDPGAAAAGFAAAGGAELAPGAALAVYRLGRASFHAAVVRRIGDAHLLVAERSLAVGGAEFDALLLAYLSGRHRDADRRFWDRIVGSGEADRRLRATLLSKIATAREQLSERDFTVITVPVADLKLSLTREELESRIRELVEESVDLVEEAMAEAGVAPQTLAGVLVAGGASRTPLALATLRSRLPVDPVVAAVPDPLLDVQAPAATREMPLVDEEGPEAPRRRLVRPLAVLAALLVLVAAVAAFGSRLGDHEAPTAGSGAAVTGPAAGPATSGAVDSPESPGGSGGAEESSGTPSPEVSEEAPADPTKSEPTTEAAPTTESAPTAAVPELVGLSTAEAHEAVADAGFSGVEQSGEWRSVFDLSHDDCEVIEQDPAPGEVVALAETVAVTFSYSGGEDECEV
ncbi:Hsp70 family protein [Glycomyces paridis]|uniref:PASTA domain-containing protein n=1 Tax=Glycomyces paridis TaxID=2126555 RepID=A0A4S8PJH8_9ACTN|nr:Hsp70 family protein [Glycomyces paridis]THV28589.1 PASTA domain-containing protein [Glycomyces paridis]